MMNFRPSRMRLTTGRENVWTTRRRMKHYARKRNSGGALHFGFEIAPV